MFIYTRGAGWRSSEGWHLAVPSGAPAWGGTTLHRWGANSRPSDSMVEQIYRSGFEVWYNQIRAGSADGEHP